ncbi:hypothetical protein CEXT_399901 [Caerostris extrusa]|uniref:Uncharacterized protein n=1 Tax=Caerostris extrusa TaxID=172846 RepID=A0AAV4UUI3_CAEEX|nr:hypothetical protein CEXT_399901 [Caerostris extrusa]
MSGPLSRLVLLARRCPRNTTRRWTTQFLAPTFRGDLVNWLKRLQEAYFFIPSNFYKRKTGCRGHLPVDLPPGDDDGAPGPPVLDDVVLVHHERELPGILQHKIIADIDSITF